MSTARIMKFERPGAPTEGKHMDGGFIQIPNEVFKAANRCLKGNMKGLLFAIAEKTYGYNKQEDDLTIAQMAECAGIRRQNASPVFHEMVEKKIISARPGKFGFIVKINPVSEWILPEIERLKIRRTSEIQTSENQTNVLNSDVGASEIQTHNIQPPKYKNIYSSTQDETAVAETQDFVAADAATGETGGRESEKPSAKGKHAEDNRRRFEAVAEKFNGVFADCPGVRKVSLESSKTNARRMKLIPAAWQIAKRRIADWQDEHGLIDGEQPSAKHCLEWFALYFERCKSDPFINGANGRSKGHENWRPSFEYLLREDVIEARVFEGA